MRPNLFLQIPFRGKAFLAPMAGFTDSAFRQIAIANGAALVFAEFVSADGLVRKSERTRNMLMFEEVERPIGIQIFGSDPEIMAQAAQIVEQFRPDVLDLNFGCPVPKVVKRGAGASLLRDLGRMEDIAAAVVEAVSLPVTAKIRSGWSEKEIVAVKAAIRLERAGIHAITVHPRTRQMGYSGKADWLLIKEVKENVAIPVIGNGDIWRPEDALRMQEETGCDFVMIARGALRNPWIFRQLLDLERGESQSFEPSPHQWLDLIAKQFELNIKYKGEQKTLKEMRKFLAYYLTGKPGARQLRSKLHLQKSVRDVVKLLEGYYEQKGK